MKNRFDQIVTFILAGMAAIAAIAYFDFKSQPIVQPMMIKVPTGQILPIIDYDQRKWALINSTGYFDFTDTEWESLCATYNQTNGTINLPQGPIQRVNQSILTFLVSNNPDSLRTNRVWITK